jgi:hypothetical protein
LLWEVDRWLLIGSVIAASVPAVMPFVNAFIYKIVIDLLVEGVQTNVFDYQQFYILIGLRVATEKFKNEEVAGHVTLVKGERSKLATIASDIL